MSLSADIAGSDSAPGLTVHDWAATRLCGAILAGSDVSVLVASRASDQISLTLPFSEATREIEKASDFMSALIRRIEEPLQHLL